MKIEIGSEFWEKASYVHPEKADNEVYLLSGRTALKFIIDDICNTRKFRKVLIPSYCCESMMEPFIASGIDTQFYKVHVDSVDYPYENDADAVLLLDFFGYVNPENEKIACCEKQAGKIVIYDATHKLDGNPAVEVYADYSFCSYRKWFYCNYAKAVKHSGAFGCSQLRANTHYIEFRDRAAEKKEKYITGLTAEKEEFLTLFSLAEQMLDEDYAGYSGESVIFDINKIASKRRENALYLIEELKKIPEIKLWRDTVQVDDVPMFVPILVDTLIRNDLRNTLIKENIYCPIHWPVSSYHVEYGELYDMELSLVCDQRYDIKDMRRIVRIIKSYFNR